MGKEVEAITTNTEHKDIKVTFAHDIITVSEQNLDKHSVYMGDSLRYVNLTIHEAEQVAKAINKLIRG